MRDLREVLLVNPPDETFRMLPHISDYPQTAHTLRLRMTMGEFGDSYIGMNDDEYYRIVRELGFCEAWAENYYRDGIVEQMLAMYHQAGAILVWETDEHRVGRAKLYANWIGDRPIGVRYGDIQVIGKDVVSGIRWWWSQLEEGKFIDPMEYIPLVRSLPMGSQYTEAARVGKIASWPAVLQELLGTSSQTIDC